MMSHDNLTWTARIADSYLKVTQDDIFISYLPLSHSAAQMIDVWMPIAAKASVYFADKNALKGSLVNTLREVRPTFFFGVPRIYEKIQEKMVEIGKSVNGLKRAVADWAKKTGLQHNLRQLEVAASSSSSSSSSTGYSYPIAKKLVFSKIKANLGFDRCRILGVGAAPMARVSESPLVIQILLLIPTLFAQETFEYFLSLDIPLYECYGMSETSGPQTGNKPGRHRLGSVGPSLDGCSTKIHEPDPDGNGEVSAQLHGLILYAKTRTVSAQILLNGRNITMGYLFDEEKTREAIEPEFGWLKTGDIGREMCDGYFEITGRIKELIITAGGENIPPVLIEDAIKRELPECLGNAMVIGDKKKFLSCFLTLKVEVDQDSLEPTNKLTSGAAEWVASVSSKPLKTVEEASSDEGVRKAIQDGIDRANSNATSNAQRIQKWLLLPIDFSVPGGELGPTLKLKRHYVTKKYNTQINNFYNV